MTLLVMVLTAATAWADDTWDGGSGTPDAQYYLKLPKTGSRSFTIPTGVESFYVYDDGGYNDFYSNDCDGSLTVTAPTDCVLRVSSGTIVLESTPHDDWLIVYDGADKNSTKLIETKGVVEGSIVTTLPTVTSTGQSLTFHFHSNYTGNHAGFGLKVTVIDATTEYAINGLDGATGGTFVASVGGKSVTEARINDVVTLTATPGSGYVLSNISVVDANNHSMNVNWTPWTNTATFTMTNSDATIVSTFTNDQTAAGGLSVNMPKTGNKPVIIPTGVKSFKVYDDGGPTGNYGFYADGYLTMTAPEGCVLQLAGNAAIDWLSYLTVYDGSTASDNKLINELGGIEGKIPTVVSSGRSMTLYFHQEGIESGAGLDLTVTVGDSAEDHAIKGLGSVTGGTIAASIGDEGVTQAKANEVVTLTVTPDIGYLLSGISVADTDGNPIAVTWEGLFNNTATFTMPLLEVTVTFSLQPIPWDGTGTEEEPYTIIYPSQLDLLAQRVNDGSGDDFAATGYKDKYFRLGANIEYTHKADGEEGAATENNYTTIGYYFYQGASSNRYFNGDFDGQGHTVSGIRIYKPGGLSTTTGNCQGLFGFTESSANIHDVILTDARITGYDNIGGIVGRSLGTVSHCYVANTVAIHAVILAAGDHGGIVGENKGNVSDCISAVTLTNSVSDAQNFGGIVGYNNGGTLRRNLVIGAVVPAATDNTHGAICGRNNDGILQSNYYHACNVAGVANDTDGAVATLRDNADNSDALALVATIATAGLGKTPLDLGWGAGKYPMQLADRTLYKDGAWNTLCLPFAIANIEAEGCPLKGATVCELDEAYITGTMLTLNFKTATTAIAAGVPYIVKWETTGDNITNPVFQGVTVSSATHDYDTQSAVPAVTTEERVRFIGTYDQKTIATENKSILFLGAANTLYYPSGKGSVNIGACRAYFKIGDGNALARQLTAFNFGFDDEGETTGIIEAEANSSLFTLHSSLPGWFSLDGRRLNGKPTKKGLYIVNGRKVVMK